MSVVTYFVALIPAILAFVVLYLVVRAAVAKGVQDAFQRFGFPLAASSRSAIRDGVLEALLALKQNETEGEEDHE